MHLNSVFCSHKRNIRTISHTILSIFFFGFCIYVINEHRYNLNQDYYKKKPLRSICQFKQCIEVAVVSVRSAFSLWMSLFLLQNTLTDDDAFRENWQMSTFVFCLFFYFVFQMEHQIYIELWVCKYMYTRFPQHDIEYMYLLINHVHIKN